MQFRFTISHDILYPSGIEVQQPEGWDDVKLTLKRDDGFHSLIEFPDGEFIWFGSAHTVLREIEDTYGPDSLVGLLIEISEQTAVWEELFNASFKIVMLEHISNSQFYKMKVPLIRDDFWATFINRKDTAVNLKATEDVDGNAITPVNPVTLPLPSQIIRQNFERDDTPFNEYVLTSANEDTDYYLLFNNSNVVIDEITERFEYGTQITIDNPSETDKYLFKVRFDGVYDFITKIRFQLFYGNKDTGIIISSGDRNIDYSVKWYYVLRKSGSLQAPVEIYNTSGSILLESVGGLVVYAFTIEDGNEFAVNFNDDLVAGDEVFIYGKFTFTDNDGNPPTANANLYYSADYDSMPARYTELSATADTSYQDTETEAYLLKDAFEAVASKITGRNSVVVSDYLDALDTCGNNYAVMLGLHVRGYSMDSKQFSRAFMELWDGADPALNLGLTYEGEQLRIENKSYFYDKDPIINFGNLYGVTRIYDQKYFYKNVETGFNTWSLESESGIDDTQTRRKYRSRFKTLGEDFKIISGFFAGSLGIEQTRRNRVEEGKDWRGDEEIMMIAVRKDGGDYRPEVGEDFTTVTNILNPDTRYNIRLGAAFLFDRWLDWLSGCMALFPDKYYFASGEGNYDGEVTKSVSDCEGSGTITGSQDFDIGDYIKLPKRYRFTYPMTFANYKIIRDNRTKSIGLSRSNSAYTPHFIDQMDYFPAQGKAEFVVDLAVIPTEENGFRFLEVDDFVIFGTEGLLFQDGEEILFQDGETALAGLDS